MFKDNIVYGPPLPGVLKREVEILCALGGRQAYISPDAVYESPKLVFVVTEYCKGRDLLSLRRRLLSDKESVGVHIPVHIVKRISSQLIRELDQCVQKGIIHRDIKPAIILLVDEGDESDLRLIDFGSGAMDEPPPSAPVVGERFHHEPYRHATYSGSGFYNFPEMFRRSYTSKKYAWSAGVTLYVFTAGYSSGGILQDTFNIMHSSKIGKLANLPGIETVPEGFSRQVLEKFLVYRDKTRSTAAEVLQCDFLCLQGRSDD